MNVEFLIVINESYFFYFYFSYFIAAIYIYGRIGVLSN